MLILEREFYASFLLEQVMVAWKWKGFGPIVSGDLTAERESKLGPDEARGLTV